MADSENRIGVFPGSFDPLHNGHLDLIERSRGLFDELIVAVLYNENKKPTFTLEERTSMLEELFADDDGIRVETFSGLLVDFARQKKARTIVRGLRSGSDLDYELPMTLMNRRMAPEVETVFLFPSSDTVHLSSSLIKEVVKLRGDAPDALPENFRSALLKKLG